MGWLSNIDKASNLTGHFLISSSHYRQLMRSGIDQSMYFTMCPSSTVQYFFINANLWIEMAIHKNLPYKKLTLNAISITIHKFINSQIKMLFLLNVTNGNAKYYTPTYVHVYMHCYNTNAGLCSSLLGANWWHPLSRWKVLLLWENTGGLHSVQSLQWW